MTTKRHTSKKRSKPRASSKAPSKPTESTATAEEKFVRDLLIRGEAALPDSEGNLPKNATHEIVEEEEGELPKIERRNFKIW